MTVHFIMVSGVRFHIFRKWSGTKNRKFHFLMDSENVQSVLKEVCTTSFRCTASSDHLQFCAFRLSNTLIARIIHLDDTVWFVAFQKWLFPPPIRKHLGRSAGICVFTEVDGKMSPQGPGICTASQTTSIFALAFVCLISSVWCILKNSQLFFFSCQMKPKKGSSKPAFVLFFSNEWNVKTHNAHHEQKNNSIFFLPLTMHVIPAWIIMINYIYKFFRLHNPFHKYTYCSSFPQHKYFNIFTATARSFPVLFESATLKPMMLNRRIICPHFVFLF